jgi:hypothetical protein
VQRGADSRAVRPEIRPLVARDGLVQAPAERS